MASFTAVDCGLLPPPNNGEIDIFNTTLGSPAVYRCNRGFTLVGVDRRVCTETGEWSDEEPECVGRSCSAQNCLLISTLHVHCLLCSPPPPPPPPTHTHTVVTCPILLDPPNGRVDVVSRVFRSTASYECDAEFLLVGDGNRTCLDTGEWSGSEPECIGMPIGRYSHLLMIEVLDAVSIFLLKDVDYFVSSLQSLLSAVEILEHQRMGVVLATTLPLEQ